MAVGDARVFPGFLTPVLTQIFFPMPSTTFLSCFCRGERRKYAGKKSRLNRGSNSQPPGHESDTLTTEPPGRAEVYRTSQPVFTQSFVLFVLGLSFSPILRFKAVSMHFLTLYRPDFFSACRHHKLWPSEIFIQVTPQC